MHDRVSRADDQHDQEDPPDLETGPRPENADEHPNRDDVAQAGPQVRRFDGSVGYLGAEECKRGVELRIRGIESRPTARNHSHERADGDNAKNIYPAFAYALHVRNGSRP